MQFKPGESGNPNGRPRNSRENNRKLLTVSLAECHEYKEDKSPWFPVYSIGAEWVVLNPQRKTAKPSSLEETNPSDTNSKNT